nr:unnamed protein product [Naegleria fowleri]
MKKALSIRGISSSLSRKSTNFLECETSSSLITSRNKYNLIGSYEKKPRFPISVFHSDVDKSLLIHSHHPDEANYSYSVNIAIDNFSPIHLLTYHHFNNLIASKLNSKFIYSPQIYPSIFSTDTHQQIQSFQFTTNNEEQHKILIDTFNKELFFPSWDSQYFQSLHESAMNTFMVLNSNDPSARFGRSILSHLYGNIPSFDEMLHSVKNMNLDNLEEQYRAVYCPSNSVFLSAGGDVEEVIASLETVSPQIHTPRSSFISTFQKPTHPSSREVIEEEFVVDESLPLNNQGKAAIAYKLNCEFSILSYCLSDTFNQEFGSLSVRPFIHNGINESMNELCFVVGVEGISLQDMKLVKKRLEHVIENIRVHNALPYLNKLQMELQTLVNYSTHSIQEGSFHSWKSSSNAKQFLEKFANCIDLLQTLSKVRKLLEADAIACFNSIKEKYFLSNREKIILINNATKMIELSEQTSNTQRSLVFATTIAPSLDFKPSAEVASSFISSRVESRANGRFLLNVQEANGDLVDISLTKYEPIYVSANENKIYDIHYYPIIAKLINCMGARDATDAIMESFKQKYFPRGIKTTVEILHDRFDWDSVKCGIVIRTQVLKKHLFKALDILEAMLNDSELKELPPHALNDDIVRDIAKTLSDEIISKHGLIGLGYLSSEAKVNPITKLNDYVGGFSQLAFLKQFSSGNLTAFKQRLSQFYGQLTAKSNTKLLLTTSSSQLESVCKVAEDFLESNPDTVNISGQHIKYGAFVKSSRDKHRFIVIADGIIPEGHRIICRSVNTSSPVTAEKAAHIYLFAEALNRKLFKDSSMPTTAKQTMDGTFKLTLLSPSTLHVSILELVETIQRFIDFGLDEIEEEELMSCKIAVMRELGDSVVLPPHERATKQFLFGITFEDYSLLKQHVMNAALEDISDAAKTLFGVQSTGHALAVLGAKKDIPQDILVMAQGKEATWEVTGQELDMTVEDYMMGGDQENEQKQETVVDEEDKPYSSF